MLCACVQEGPPEAIIESMYAYTLLLIFILLPHKEILSTFFFCRALVINYKSTFAVLGDLVDSVKPEGRLKNTIAEVGIYVLNGKNKRGATRFVMPLYVTVSGMNIFMFLFD